MPAHRQPFVRLSVLIWSLTCALPASAQVAPSNDTIAAMDLPTLRSALDSGEVSAEQVLRVFLERIDGNNRQNRNINAVVTLNGKAIEEARQWDRDRASQPDRRSLPLAGIPFLAKDNFDTAGIVTSGGSLALSDSKPARNATVVQKLLDQGAILIGKTNMSELAASYGWLGYSGFGGQTLNPYNSLRDPSGSSSGSAAAVAAGFAPFALGTDTSGSIRAPASVTGTVGMRPTFGLTSRAGIIPLSLSADTSGVITRNVRDQAIVLDAIQGEDPADAATRFAARPSPNFAAGLGLGSLAGRRIAIIDNFDGGNPDVDRVKAEAGRLLEEAGATVEHVTLPAIYENLWSAVLGPVGTAEFRPQFEAYLATLPEGQPKNAVAFMEALDRWTGNGTKDINPARYKGLREGFDTQTTASADHLAIVGGLMPELRRQIVGALDLGRYDAMMFPTMSCPASVVHGASDPTYVCEASDAYAASYMASSTGLPEVSLRAGTAAGNVPVGVSFLGRPGDDGRVLNLAYAFEAALQDR